MLKLVICSIVLVIPQVGSINADSLEIPAYFDVRDHWVGCGLTVLDQGQCGDCWAASATSVFGDRLCIWFDANGNALPKEHEIGGINRLFQKAGSCTGDGTSHAAHNHGCKKTSFFVSPQALVSCATLAEDENKYPYSFGCQGGEAIDAWSFFYYKGLSPMTSDGDNGCTPYTSGKCSGHDPNGNGCRTCAGVVDQCVDTGLPPKFFRASSVGVIHDPELRPRDDTSIPRSSKDKEALRRQVRNMQIEIMTNGPIHVCVDMFTNFQATFNNAPLTIYNKTEGLMSGGHCLNIMGWGHDDKSELDYWIIKNSWGEAWGSYGTFRFIRGVDLGGIESDVWSGCPANSNCELTNGTKPLRLQNFDDITSTRRLKAQSRPWRGGYWRKQDMTRVLSDHFLSLGVAHAYEKLYGEPTRIHDAISQAKGVWTQAGVKGTRIRVDFPGKGGKGLRSVVTYHDTSGQSFTNIENSLD